MMDGAGREREAAAARGWVWGGQADGQFVVGLDGPNTAQRCFWATAPGVAAAEPAAAQRAGSNGSEPLQQAHAPRTRSLEIMLY